MSFTHALTTQSHRNSPRLSRRQRRRAIASALEHLEPRCLLSGITSYAVDPATLPYGITHDNTGAVWYTDAAQGSLTRVTLDANHQPVFQTFPINAGHGTPIVITFDPIDGNLYLAAGTNIERVNTSGQVTGNWNVVAASDVNLATVPVELTVSHDGAIWYTTQGAPHFDEATQSLDNTVFDNFVGRLDPSTGNTQLFAVTETDCQTHGITTDNSGNVWFTMTPITAGTDDPNVNWMGTAHIGRIAVATDTISYFDAPTTQGTLSDIRTASDGSLWYLSADEVGTRFATTPTPDLLGHIVYNPAGGGSANITEYQIPKLADQTGVQPTSLEIDPAGKIWFSEFLDAKVSTFDPLTGDFTRIDAPAGSTPGLMTISGSDLWVTSPFGATPSLLRVDLATAAPSIFSPAPNLNATTAVLDTNPLVTFTSQATGDFSYTIDYGNGQTASGTVTNDGSGVYTINADVTYAAAGTYATRIVIADASGEIVSRAGAATVQDPISNNPIVAQGINLTGQQDIALASNMNINGDHVLAVATFTAPAGTYTATVDWGDGTSSTALVRAIAVVGGQVQYAVNFKQAPFHTYHGDGVFHGLVTITGGGNSATAAFNATVADTPMVVSTNLSINPPTKDGSITVAKFTDDLEATTGWFTASINWGDGTTSAGLILVGPGGPGHFFVVGHHTYTQTGRFTITTTITNSVDGTSAVAAGYTSWAIKV